MRLRPVPLLKINRVPLIKFQLRGSPRINTPKEATKGTSMVIITLTFAAGMRTKAWLMESCAPIEKTATAATPTRRRFVAEGHGAPVPPAPYNVP